MEFKVAFISEKNIVKKEESNIKSYGKYFWIRNEKENNLMSKGVKANNTMEDATKFIKNNKGDGVFEYQYIIIDSDTKTVYYRKYGKNDLIKALLRNFKITKENIYFEVDIDKLKSISELKIETFNREQLSLVDPNYNGDQISRDFADDIPISNIHIYKYNEDTFFKKNAIKSFNKLKQDKNTKVTIKGTDENGNSITASEKIVSTIALNIEYKDIVEEGNIEIRTIIDEIDKLSK